MRTRAIWLALWLGALGLVIASQMTAADRLYACSGSGLNSVNLDNATIPGTVVVRGHVGFQNSWHGYIFVDDYLIGSPSHTRLVVATQSETTDIALDLGYEDHWRCERGHYRLPNTSHEYIFFLWPQLDGTYGVRYSMTFEDPKNPPLVFGEAYDYRSVEITEAQLLQDINADPQPPIDADIEFPPGPMHNPALILDAEGNAYLLPIDAEAAEERIHLASGVLDVQASGSFIALATQDHLILHERWSGTEWWQHWSLGVDCSQVQCFQFSADGLLLAIKTSADTLQICEMGLITLARNGPRTPPYNFNWFCQDQIAAMQFEGHTFRFSPDSLAIAVWLEDRITVYNAPENRIGFEVVSVASTTPMPESNHSGVWSADSRWLAYSDTEGLWLWDVFTQEPFLLLEAGPEAIPNARAFSESGRYLAISQGGTHTILDLRSDLVFPDGIISPDERVLIRADTVNQTPVPAEQCSLLDGRCEDLCPDLETNVQTLTAAWGHYPEGVSTVLCVDGVCGLQGCSKIQDGEIWPAHMHSYQFYGRSGAGVHTDYVVAFELRFQAPRYFYFNEQIAAPISDIYLLPMPYESE